MMGAYRVSFVPACVYSFICLFKGERSDLVLVEHGGTMQDARNPCCCMLLAIPCCRVPFDDKHKACFI